MLLDHNSASNVKLKQLQDIMFEIALIFKEICEKHNLRYYMAYGTLLGAVRHQDFIPWDDDMDFTMPRKDWERFIQVAPKELEIIGRGNYVLRECRLDGGLYKYLWIRIVDTRTSFSSASRVADIGGIYIDIDPLDGTFKNNFLQKMHSYITDKLITARWYTIFRKPEHTTTMINKIGLKFIHYIFGNVRAYRIINRIIGCKDYDRAHYVRSMGYASNKEVIAKDVYGDPIKIKFRDTEFNAPEQYDKYLKNFYGDYMTPPPENGREGHYDLDHVLLKEEKMINQ